LVNVTESQVIAASNIIEFIPEIPVFVNEYNVKKKLNQGQIDDNSRVAKKEIP